MSSSSPFEYTSFFRARDQDMKLKPKDFIFFLLAFLAVEFYYISPLYFIKKYEHKLIELYEVPFIQLLCIILNCSAYMIFGIKGRGDFQNLLTNSIGLLLGLLVLFRLWYVIQKDKGSEYYFYLFLILNIIAQIFYFIYRSENAEELSEFVAKIMNVTMYLVINQNDFFAWNQKKAEKIPILSACLGLVASFFWFLFAYFTSPNKRESNSSQVTQFSNGVSIFVLLVPIAEYVYLKLMYRNGKEEISGRLIDGEDNEKDERKNDGEINENIHNEIEEKNNGNNNEQNKDPSTDKDNVIE